MEESESEFADDVLCVKNDAGFSGQSCNPAHVIGSQSSTRSRERVMVAARSSNVMVCT